MGNKKLYYKYKQEGRCTKCGDVLGDSPSTVRCGPCHQRFLENQRNLQTAKPKVSRPQPKKSEPSSQTDLDSAQENSLDTHQAIVCVACGAPINTFGRLCQDCLANKEFTQKEAIHHAGPKCAACGEDSNLMVVSDNPTEPMKLHGPPLYKKIIHSPKFPIGYKILCQPCHRNATIALVIKKRADFDSQNQHKWDFTRAYSEQNDDNEIEIEVENES